MTETFKATVETKPNGELLKMVYEIDEWSPAMLEEVEKELKRRDILPDDIKIRKQQLIQDEEAELSKGKEASLVVLFIGWVTAFGLLGIGIGYHYAFSKVKSKYTEKRYFKFNERARRDGSYLFYTALLLSAITITYRVLISRGTNI